MSHMLGKERQQSWGQTARGSAPAGFPHADCGSLGAWLTSLSSAFPPLNGLKVTGNQKEMKRVAPLKQMRLKKGRGKKVRDKTKLRLQALNSLKSLDPRPPKFSSTEVSSKLNVLNTVLSIHYLEDSSCQALAPLRRQKSTTWGMVPEIQFPI